MQNGVLVKEKEYVPVRKKAKKKTWLVEGIVVKLIGDKKNKYYKCKGIVVRTDPPRIFIVDDGDYGGREVTVDDNDLETVVKTGKEVIALKGDYKGKVGIVTEKKGDMAKVEFPTGGTKVNDVIIELDYIAQYRPKNESF